MNINSEISLSAHGMPEADWLCHAAEPEVDWRSLGIRPLNELPPGPWRSLGGRLDYTNWAERDRFVELDRAIQIHQLDDPGTTLEDWCHAF